ncbi:MAG: O-acetyl-ADP-ribose deacetylase [Bacteroidota bacterium]
MRVWTGDITTLHVDAIVNAANTSLLGGGGVDGAIHRAAGPKLLEACREIHELRPGVRCPTGQARITRGVKLPARHVIHAVGPRWHGGEHGEDDALASAYRSSLGLAEAHQLEAIAIPAISTGVYGFPPARAARIAVETIRAWQGREHPVWVTLVGFDEAASHILRAALAGERDAKP